MSLAGEVTHKLVPDPWERTNHSRYRIMLRSIHRKIWRKEIEDAAKRYFGGYVNDLTDIREVGEDSRSANFKILCRNGPPILFRVNRAIGDGEVVRTIEKVAEYLFLVVGG